MVTIVRSKRFEGEYKRFVKHNLLRAESIIKALTLFVKNHKHPSLHIEKLKGSSIWSMRLSEGNRLFFLWINENTVMLVDVGQHDKYKNY